MTDSNCDRWMTMTDRAALGELLSDAERRWLTDHAASCSECGRESKFWSALGNVMTQPEILELPVTESSNETRKKRSYAASAWLQGRHSWALGLAAGIALTLGTAWFLREKPKAAIAEPTAPAARLVSMPVKCHWGRGLRTQDKSWA